MGLGGLNEVVCLSKENFRRFGGHGLSPGTFLVGHNGAVQNRFIMLPSRVLVCLRFGHYGPIRYVGIVLFCAVSSVCRKFQASAVVALLGRYCSLGAWPLIRIEKRYYYWVRYFTYCRTISNLCIED